MEDKERKAIIKQAISLNGKSYYTCRQFAQLTKRTERAVRLLIHKGNKFGKLPCIHLNRTILIPAEQLHTFKFTFAGRSKYVQTFLPDGTEVVNYDPIAHKEAKNIER